MWDGRRRYGKPRTDEERRMRHYRRYGTTRLPPRGTGLRFLGCALGELEEIEGEYTKDIHVAVYGGLVLAGMYVFGEYVLKNWPR